MRMPAAQGFYPWARRPLERMLSGFRDVIERDGSIVAAIVPHAGYMFSGRLAARIYQMIDPGKSGRRFVILGVNHYGIGERVAKSEEDWWTPFGPARTDPSVPLPTDELAHLREHSIEVQLPLMKYFIGEFSFTPVSLSSLEWGEVRDVAATLDEWMDGRIVIASSDFTHYGPDYGYDVFSGELDDIFRKAKAMDDEVVEYITNVKPTKFFELSMERTICGRIPISVLLQIAKTRGWKGEVTGFDSSFIKLRQRNFVNYYAIVFREQK